MSERPGGPTGDYGARYQAALREGARRSALRVLPEVLRLVPARSMVDFGCGSGAWIEVARGLGVSDALGVDGEWARHEEADPLSSAFRVADLRLQVDLGRRFDLALCLEVAEHLPPSAAPTLIDTLTRHADAVLFSAAIPGQGGEGHVNEAWPAYWRRLFEARGFAMRDVLRRTLWDDDLIAPWYRQNLLFYVNGDPRDAAAGALADLPASTAPDALVHPALWNERIGELEPLRREAARLRAELAGALAKLDHLGRAWRDLEDERDALRRDAEERRAPLLRRLAKVLRLARGGRE